MPKTTRRAAETPADETPQPRVRRTRRAVKPTARKRAAAPEPVTHEQIALRAYELHLLGAGADPMENWLRAERELVAAA
jgi:hypothetical protein